MIRYDYIHEFDLFDDVTRAINISESTCKELLNEYQLKCDELRLQSFFESDDDIFYAEGARQVVEGIGTAVEKMIDKVIEMIKKVADTFNEFIWNRKSDAQKMEIILKKHPNLANEIKFAWERGDLNIKDIKSLQDLMDGSYDLLDKLNKGKIEPSKAEEHFNKLVSKWQKYGKPIVEIAAGVTTVITATKAISSLYPTLLKNKLDKETLEGRVKVMRSFAKGQKMDKKIKDGKSPFGPIERAKNKIINQLCSIINEQCKGRQSLMRRFGSWLSTNLQKYESTIDKAKEKVDRTAREGVKQWQRANRDMSAMYITPESVSVDMVNSIRKLYEKGGE